MHRQPHLFEIVDALGPTGRFASRLNGGQKQSDQYGDNSDDDEEFNQCEAVAKPSLRMG
jgi:hypothetical protein